VLSLFRKKVINELFGQEFFQEVKLLTRNPNGLTPSKETGKYLLRRAEKDLLKKEISKFSEKDAENIEHFEKFLGRMVKLIDPLLDMPPPERISIFDKKFYIFLAHIFKHRNDLYDFYHFLTSSAEYYLDKYFETDCLKATFATDAVIGAMKGPQSTGSAYVLLHHVMGDLDKEGSWFYVQGGNGALSTYIANKAVQEGVTIALNTPVEKFLINKETKSIEGVLIKNHENGEEIEIKSNLVVTNCDMYTTYFKLMEEKDRNTLLTEKFNKSLELMDYNSPVFKINLIVKDLPKFRCFNDLVNSERYQGDYNKLAKEHLTGTIHLNCDNVKMIQDAYVEALSGKPSTKPIIEMTIPSVVDDTLVPKNTGHHVIGLFVQYAPNKLNNGTWTNQRKRDFAHKVYDEIEKYSPGFIESILFDDILSPADLESEFSLRGGNIFHGVMDLSSIFFCRPFYGNCTYKQPIKNLYSCSSAMHPGGGVMGAPGRNCALTILNKI
jgi:phytoene dehydrogenase-like protein